MKKIMLIVALVLGTVATQAQTYIFEIDSYQEWDDVKDEWGEWEDLGTLMEVIMPRGNEKGETYVFNPGRDNENRYKVLRTDEAVEGVSDGGAKYKSFRMDAVSESTGNYVVIYYVDYEDKEWLNKVAIWYTDKIATSFAVRYLTEK
jgi:hypothetical protein